MSDWRGILFAGGGTGGHIYPNMAVAEALRAGGFAGPVRFLVSGREVDERIMQESGYPFDVSPARGWSWSPGGVVHCVKAVFQARRVVREHGIDLVVSTGGFVGGTAALGARMGGARVAVLNVDAVWGKGNRWLRGIAHKVFSVTGTGGERIGVPLRSDAVWRDGPGAAKRVLGLSADRPVLLVAGGSQGAASVNEAMTELVSRDAARSLLSGWQVLHVAGRADALPAIQAAYDRAPLPAVVIPYCPQMGAAWCAADLAITRAGALSVAEAQAAGTPAIFMPYPHHRDQHQKLNATGLVRASASVIVEDANDPGRNADRLLPILTKLLTDGGGLERMSRSMRDSYIPGGADQIAAWVLEQAGRGMGA